LQNNKLERLWKETALFQALSQPGGTEENYKNQSQDGWTLGLSLNPEPLNTEQKCYNLQCLEISIKKQSNNNGVAYSMSYLRSLSGITVFI
jgi:hypothetical protein